MSDLIENIKLSYANFLGSKIRRKIVVIESDDWGTIRSVQKSKLQSYAQEFPNFHSQPYLKYDTLASAEDLDALWNVLTSFKDISGKHPVITFNTVLANPKFDEIKKSNFFEYKYEIFTETLERFYPNENVFRYWKEGIDAGVMFPQFHGREHVNVPVWLQLLQNNNQEMIKAFEYGTWSTPKGAYPPTGVKLQASLDFSGKQPVEYQNLFLKEGLSIFEDVFGFKSKTWIPNNFICSNNLFSEAKSQGVIGMQGMRYHAHPKGIAKNGNRVFTKRKFGIDSSGMFHLVRNCVFEPSQSKQPSNAVGKCLSQMANAFFWNKPAIITSHRLNFIGAIDKQNRTENLTRLNELIIAILKKWPDVVFMDSASLLKEYNSY